MVFVIVRSWYRLLSEKYNGYCGCFDCYSPMRGRERLFVCRGTFTHNDVYNICDVVNYELENLK